MGKESKLNLCNGSNFGNNNDNKYCPLIDQKCMAEECALYYKIFSKCLIEVINYNLFALKKAIKNDQ